MRIDFFKKIRVGQTGYGERQLPVTYFNQEQKYNIVQAMNVI